MLTRIGTQALGCLRILESPSPETYGEVMLMPFWASPPFDYDRGLGGLLNSASPPGELPVLEDYGITPETLSGEVPDNWVPGQFGRPGTLDILLPESIGGAPSHHAITTDIENCYTLEIRDDEGVLLFETSSFAKGSLKRRLNEASILQFTIPFSWETMLSHLLVSTNCIWLRDWRGFVLEPFLISEVTVRREGDALFADVLCFGVIRKFAKEPISLISPMWSLGWEKMRVIDILDAILSIQVQPPFISLGSIDPAIANYETLFSIQDSLALETLKKLQETLPKSIAGFIWIDTSFRLNWSCAAWSAEEPIEIGKRLGNWTTKVSYDALCTRVYYYGAGLDKEYRLTLIHAGEAIRETEVGPAPGDRPGGVAG